MNTVELGQTLVIVVLTAFATAVLNNFLELCRLRAMPKRETTERMAYDRKRLLQETLAELEQYVSSFVQLVAVETGVMRMLIGEADVDQMFGNRALRFASGMATTLMVGDENLTTAPNNFGAVTTKAATRAMKGETKDEEWVSPRKLAIDRVGTVLRLCTKIPQKEYGKVLAGQ